MPPSSGGSLAFAGRLRAGWVSGPTPGRQMAGFGPGWVVAGPCCAGAVGLSARRGAAVPCIRSAGRPGASVWPGAPLCPLSGRLRRRHASARKAQNAWERRCGAKEEEGQRKMGVWDGTRRAKKMGEKKLCFRNCGPMSGIKNAFEKSWWPFPSANLPICVNTMGIPDGQRTTIRP